MAPTTVGTSSSDTTILLPNASASTDRSMKLTLAPVSQRSATRRMASACFSEEPMSSATVMPMGWIAGKDRTGTAFFLSAEMVSATHLRISIAWTLLYAAYSAASSAATLAASPASSV